MVQQNFQGRPEFPRGQGLYDFEQEHDAYGVGLIADLDNRKSHRSRRRNRSSRLLKSASLRSKRSMVMHRAKETILTC